MPSAAAETPTVGRTLLRRTLLRRTLLRRIALVLGALAIVAPTLSAQAPRLRVKLPAFAVEVALDTLVYNREAIDAPPAQVFSALRAVYADLKIPRPVADSANGYVANLRLPRTYTLGDERLSVYFNCGLGMTGANADSWRLTMAMATYVTADGAGKSKLGTGVVAQAQDMGGASKDPTTCGSSGLLEARIITMVKERLAAGK